MWNIDIFKELQFGWSSGPSSECIRIIRRACLNTLPESSSQSLGSDWLVGRGCHFNKFSGMLMLRLWWPNLDNHTLECGCRWQMVNKCGSIGRTQRALTLMLRSLNFILIEVRRSFKGWCVSDISDCACEKFIWRQVDWMKGTRQAEDKDS